MSLLKALAKWVLTVYGLVYFVLCLGVLGGFLVGVLPLPVWQVLTWVSLILFFGSIVSVVFAVRRELREPYGLLMRFIGSTLMRGILFKILKPCGKCGRSHVDAALARIGGDRDSARCIFGRAFYHFLHRLLDLVLGLARIKEDWAVGFVTGHPGFRRGMCNVLWGVARYGLTKPMVAARGPLVVVWDLTRRCNLDCVHCYSNAGSEFAGLPPEEGGDLGFEERLQVIDMLAEAGVVALAFSGGEPMLADRFWDLARYARDKGFLLYMATNGTLIRDVATAERLKEAGFVYVEVSLDSVDPVVHDRFRGVPGAWDRAVRGIRASAEAGIYTVIATTLTKMTYDGDLGRLFELRRELGAHNNMFFNFIPTGRGREIILSDLSPEEREHAMEIIYENQGGLTTAPQYARYTLARLCAQGGGPVAVSHLVLPLSAAGKIAADLVGGCGVGRVYCAIEANGDLQPCVFMPIRLGNVLVEGFQNLWENHPVLQALRARRQLKGYCASCEYSVNCGGCRARAWGYFGDLHAPDPGCIRNKSQWEQLRSEILTEEPISPQQFLNNREKQEH